MTGPGFERLKAASRAEAVRADTVKVQAKARAEAAERIAAVAKSALKKGNAKPAKKSEHLTDGMKIKVLKNENPFTKGSEIYRRAGYVLAADGKTVADAKRGRDGTIVRAMVDRGLIKVIAMRA